MPGWIVTDYSELIRLDPNFTRAYWCRGEAYGRSNVWDKAVADYTVVIGRDRKAYRPLLRRGECYLERGEADKGIADLTEVIRLNPEFFTMRALWRRGDAFLKKGEYERAIADYKEEIRLESGRRGHYFDGYSHRGLAIAYSKLGHEERSIKEEYEQALQAGMFGDYEGATTRSLAEIDRKKGDLRKAMDLYVRAISLHNMFSPPSKPIPAYSELIQIDPSYAPLYCRRGREYMKNGDIDKAIADFSKAIHFDLKAADRWHELGFVESNPHPALLDRAKAYERKGDFANAIADYTELTRLNPAAGYRGRSRANLQIGSLAAAIADYSELIHLTKGDEHEPYAGRAEAFFRTGDLDRAIADYTEAIRIDRRDGDSYTGRGTAYLRKAELDQAIADFTKGTQGHSCKSGEKNAGLNWAAYSGRGDANMAKGKMDDAIGDFTIAIAINPRGRRPSADAAMPTQRRKHGTKQLRISARPFGWTQNSRERTGAAATPASPRASRTALAKTSPWPRGLRRSPNWNF